MKKMDFKEIINPFILLATTVLIVFLLGQRDLSLLFYSFILFFGISFTNNLVLIHRKVVNKFHYLWVYSELFLLLVIVVPLFYIIGISKPIVVSFFVLGITDFLIQTYYNILPRKGGKEIVKLWKDKLVKSERVWFHPISLQKYTFNDFTTEIVEPSETNPAFTLICHHCLFSFNLYKSTINHHYGGKNTTAFQIYLTKDQISSLRQSNPSNQSWGKQDLVSDLSLLASLKKLNKNLSNNIITAYEYLGKLKIVFKKGFVLSHSNEVYSFLKKINEQLKPN